MAFKQDNPGCCCECVLFRDDFMRADSADLGAAWDSGGWGISGNTAAYDGSPSDRLAFYDTPVFGPTAPEQRDAILVRVRFEVAAGNEVFAVAMAADKLGDRLTVEFRASTTGCWQIEAIDNANPVTDTTVDSHLLASFDRPVDANGDLIIGEYRMDVCFFPEAYPSLSHTAAVVRGPQGNVLARATGRDFAEGNYVGIESTAGNTPKINSFSVWTHRFDSTGFPVSANGGCPDCNIALPCELNRLDAAGVANGTAVNLTCDWSQQTYDVDSEQIVFGNATLPAQPILSQVEDPFAAIDFGGIRGKPAHSIEVVIDNASRGTMRLFARDVSVSGPHAWGEFDISSGGAVTFSVGDTVQGTITSSSTGVGGAPITATLCVNGNFVILTINGATIWGSSVVGTRTFAGQNGKSAGFQPKAILSGDEMRIDSVRFLQHSRNKSGCQPCAGGDCVSCCTTGATPFDVVVSGLSFTEDDGSVTGFGDAVAIQGETCIWGWPAPILFPDGIITVVDPSDPNNTVTNNASPEGLLFTIGQRSTRDFITETEQSFYNDFEDDGGACLTRVLFRVNRIIGLNPWGYQALYEGPAISGGVCSGLDVTLNLITCLSGANIIASNCPSPKFPSTITVST